MPPVVELTGITKAFPGVVANDGVDLRVEAGEVHGLLGENGAGKSTLMAVLCGLEQPDAGTIALRGEPVVLRSPADALARGVAVVQQHFALVPTLSVAENVVLGAEPGRRVSGRKVEAAVGELCRDYDLDLDPAARVADLSLGARQRVEILKCLHRRPDVLVFDEPTTVLTPLEVDALLGTVRCLAAEGRAVVLITHKLDELLEVTDRVTVLRAGRMVATLATGEADAPTLARLMVGREVRLRSAAAAAGLGVVAASTGLRSPPTARLGDAPAAAAAATGVAAGERPPPVLELREVSARDRTGARRLDDVSLAVAPGEVLGIAGVEGNGQRELVEVLCGTRRLDAGDVLVAGSPCTTPRQLASAGVRVVTEDRHATGVVLDMSVAENLVVDRIGRRPYSRLGLVDRRAVDASARRLMADHRVVAPSPATPMRSLSGGNQQRAVLARELGQGAVVLVAAQPTRGLDVGAIEEVTERLLAAKAAGTALLLVSSDLAEVLALSDRVGVLTGGRLVATLDRADATLEVLGPLMAGLGAPVPA